ncbi:trypsin-like serine peptidase [Pararhodospirillum oryzae]|uniref:Peptidase S1 n=1 Tax=Pararhodospirillum oryzae TaxID=478448 RepID=A0A512H5H7_9PROT|nr:trypsin-like serine protease [Pararhodospirillum oryzae]GEO80687.1 peptidase S1 [Pararhodospirillum oryzae]
MRGGRRRFRRQRRAGFHLPVPGLLAMAVLGATVLPPEPAFAQTAAELPRESDDAMLHRLKPGLKGEDDRIGVDASTWPWVAVGRVNRSDGSFCTGTLVAPDKVVTAAHCLWNRRTQNWMPASGLTFVAGYQRGAWVEHAAVARAHPSPTYRPNPSGKTTQPALDWAVLDLAHPLDGSLGHFGTRPNPLRGLPLVQVGYSSDRRHVQTANIGCHLLGQDKSGTLLHDCDTVSGDSGSPLVIWDSDGPRIVAVHVGTVTTHSGSSLGVAAPIGSALPGPLAPARGTVPIDQGLVALLVGKLGYSGADAFHRAVRQAGPSGQPFTAEDLGLLLSGSAPPAGSAEVR